MWADVRNDLTRFADDMGVEEDVINAIKQKCMTEFVAPENRAHTSLDLTQPLRLGNDGTLTFHVHCERKVDGGETRKVVMGVIIDSEHNCHTYIVEPCI